MKVYDEIVNGIITGGCWLVAFGLVALGISGVATWVRKGFAR